MIITRVVLQNYGVYSGRNEFDFTCTEQKPIVLIGGTNGAGKTTLFESIMLCLYGISTMEKRSTKRSYEQFLASKIHRYLKNSTRADHASISVQFRSFHNNKEVEYRVERSWLNEGDRINEQLSIKKRDSHKSPFIALDTVEKSQWQSFIEDMIPKGIINLFFFDGEKIVKMAKEGTEDITIRESFKSLLGIELVEQLYTDLQVNMTRNLTNDDKLLQEDFDRLKSEKDNIADTNNRMIDKIAQKQTEIDSLQLEIDNMESKLINIGGTFASNRTSVIEELAEQKTNYDIIHKHIESICSDVLPFALIPSKLQSLSEQIKKDDLIKQDIMGQKAIIAKTNKIISELKDSDFWINIQIDDDSRVDVVNSITKLFKHHNDQPSAKPLFDFSYSQSTRILDIIQKANTSTLKDLQQNTAKLRELSEKITTLECSLANAPNDDEIGPLLSSIGNVHNQIGMLQSEIEHMEEKISSSISLEQHLNTKLRNIVSQIYKNKKSIENVEITQNVQMVLEEFIEQLRLKKISILEQYLLDAIKMLMHKRNFIHSVTVDPETFEITLYRKNRDRFSKELLSEGEKQMFAMAVIWALAKTSGRPLPFMIDTPLARLDEEHRTNILEQFFPTASHQVLIFSTDTEIKYDDFVKLEQNMMRSYAMEYVEEEGATIKHDGYFWNKRGKKIVAI